MELGDLFDCKYRYECGNDRLRPLQSQLIRRGHGIPPNYCSWKGFQNTVTQPPPCFAFERNLGRWMRCSRSAPGKQKKLMAETPGQRTGVALHVHFQIVCFQFQSHSPHAPPCPSDTMPADTCRASSLSLKITTFLGPAPDYPFPRPLSYGPFSHLS